MKIQTKTLKHTKTNLTLSKHKFKNCSYLWAYCCAQLSYITQHWAVLFTAPLNCKFTTESFSIKLWNRLRSDRITAMSLLPPFLWSTVLYTPITECIPVAVWISKQRRLRWHCLVAGTTARVRLEEECFIRLKIHYTNLIMQQLR